MFNPNNENEIKHIENITTVNIKTLIIEGSLFDNVHDYMKMRIDKNMLNILKKSGNIFNNGITMS